LTVHYILSAQSDSDMANRAAQGVIKIKWNLHKMTCYYWWSMVLKSIFWYARG